ncbi:MAG TPA: hypothetical protein V6C97_10990 [Oculatellaceae cyanobacterium]
MSAQRIKENTKYVLLLLSLASLFSFSQSSQAQFQRSVKKENFDNGEILKSKVALNSLPDYSGRSVFIFGRRVQSEAGTAITESFYVAEPSTQVIEWYKQALSSYGWKVVTSDKASINAQHQDNASVNITATSIQSPHGRARLKISYRSH